MTEPADRPARCTTLRGGRGAGLAFWWVQWLCLGAAAPLVSPDYAADRRQLAYLLLHFGAFTAAVSSLRTARLGIGRLGRLWVGLAVYLGCGVPLAIAAFLHRSRRDIMSPFEVALDEAVWRLPVVGAALAVAIGVGALLAALSLAGIARHGATGAGLAAGLPTPRDPRPTVTPLR